MTGEAKDSKKVPQHWLGRGLGTALLGVGLPLGVFVLTLAVWLPRLYQLRDFGDDLTEALYSQYDMLAQRGWPRKALYPPYGSLLFPYSLGLFMELFGPSALLPRLFVALANAGGG